MTGRLQRSDLARVEETLHEMQAKSDATLERVDRVLSDVQRIREAVNETGSALRKLRKGARQHG